MVFNKIIKISEVEDFENNVLSRVSNLPLFLLLKNEISKRKWDFEISVYRIENDFKKYASHLCIDILDQNNKSVGEVDEPNCTLMLCEPICFVNRGRINGIDLTTDKEFLESLESLVNKVKKHSIN